MFYTSGTIEYSSLLPFCNTLTEQMKQGCIEGLWIDMKSKMGLWIQLWVISKSSKNAVIASMKPSGSFPCNRWGTFGGK